MLPAGTAAVDEARAFKNANVLGNGVERHGIRAGKLGDARFAAGKAFEDGAAGGVGESEPSGLWSSCGADHIQPQG